MRRNSGYSADLLQNRRVAMLPATFSTRASIYRQSSCLPSRHQPSVYPADGGIDTHIQLKTQSGHLRPFVHLSRHAVAHSRHSDHCHRTRPLCHRRTIGVRHLPGGLRKCRECVLLGSRVHFRDHARSCCSCGRSRLQLGVWIVPGCLCRCRIVSYAVDSRSITH